MPKFLISYKPIKSLHKIRTKPLNSFRLVLQRLTELFEVSSVKKLSDLIK